MSFSTSKLTAAILVGGKGTRLRPLTFLVPKPMVTIKGKPFLWHLLSRLSGSGIRSFVLLTGYKKQAVRGYFEDGLEWGWQISYSEEDERNPLGTGGALVAARGLLSGTILAMNGDSWVEFELAPFLDFHNERKAIASILVMRGPLGGRGAISASRTGLVEKFGEKQGTGEGLFNTGVYLIEKRALGIFAREIAAGRLKESFSLEKQGFPLLMKKRKLYAQSCKGRFVDIGTFGALAGAHKAIR